MALRASINIPERLIDFIQIILFINYEKLIETTTQIIDLIL